MNEFEKYITTWCLTPDGESIKTPSSHLLPVRYDNKPAMLKIAQIAEEQTGGKLMLWWDGDGAARILAHDKQAFLMERAIGTSSLTALAKQGQDDEATRIICSVVNHLHTPRNNPVPTTLVPLSRWFRSLVSAKTQHEGILNQAALIAQALLNDPQEQVVLHGDIHHGNILDFGEHGWLAIDPKGLIGERGFDYANILCNPDKAIALKSGRLEHQTRIIAELTGLTFSRLIQWIVAYAALSATWHIEDGTDPELPLEVVKIALSALHP